MYGKIFEQMYDSSIAEDWKTMIVFQQMIVLADEEGNVDMTMDAIHRRTNLPMDIIQHGIKALQEPDSMSRSVTQQGKRIALIDDHRDWGWYLINYKYYRDLATREQKRIKARERKRKQREKEADAPCHAMSRMSRHTDTDVDTDNNNTFDLFWNAYPKKVDKKKALTAFKNLTKEKQQKAIKDCQTRYQGVAKQFVPNPTTYIHGERWEDEVVKKETKQNYSGSTPSGYRKEGESWEDYQARINK